jgi:hypothetical protein
VAYECNLSSRCTISIYSVSDSLCPALASASAASPCTDTFYFVLTCRLFSFSCSAAGMCKFTLHKFIFKFRSDLFFLVFLFSRRYVCKFTLHRHAFCFVLTCRLFSFSCSAGGMCKFTLHRFILFLTSDFIFFSIFDYRDR